MLLKKKNILAIILGLIIIIGFFLRFYKISTIPHGLSIDEAAIGNDAYAILKTGRDTHGKTFPIFFESLGDYKPPVYIYLTSLSIAALGKNELAVRLSSVISGTAAILILYLLVSEFFGRKTGIIASGLLAISPWHLQLSRAGFEANTGLTLFLSGVLFLVYFYKRKRMIFLYTALVVLAGSGYTYHSYRILSPIIVFLSLGYFFQKEKQDKRTTATALILFILFYAPLAAATFTGGAARFSQTSAFSQDQNLELAKKIAVYPAVYIRNYLLFFSPSYFFIYGDTINRHQIVGYGPQPVWQLPFLLTGLWLVWQKKEKEASKLILFLFLLSPIAGALAQPAPHTIRGSLILIPELSCTALGLGYFLKKAKKQYLLPVIFLIIFETATYFHLYYGHYAVNSEEDWGGKYKETIREAQRLGGARKMGIKFAPYFSFGDSYLKFYVGRENMLQAKAGADKPEIYITQEMPKELIGKDWKFRENIYYDNENKNIFAQLWERPPEK